jgi:hypothetical protein
MPPETASTPTNLLALLPLPSLDGLSQEQVRGAACIWCADPLDTATAVDLGERRHKRLDGRYSTFPRACRGCVHTEAYRTILNHGGSCEQCVDNLDSCETGVSLRRLMREYR